MEARTCPHERHAIIIIHLHACRFTKQSPDYLLHLKSQIKSQLKPGHQSQPDDRHLDQAAYWQERYSQTQDTLTREQDISFSLRRQVDQLQSQLAQSHSTSPSSTIVRSSAKRKPVHDARNQAKKLRSGESVVSIVPASFAIDFDAFDADQPGMFYLCSLSNLFCPVVPVASPTFSALSLLFPLQTIVPIPEPTLSTQAEKSLRTCVNFTFSSRVHYMTATQKDWLPM